MAAADLGSSLGMPAVVLVLVTVYQLLFIPLRLERAHTGFLNAIRTSLRWPLGGAWLQRCVARNGPLRCS